MLLRGGIPVEGERIDPFSGQGSPQKPRVAEFEERFQRGEYLGILETYKVQWSLEKVARDTLQNFYDVNETLDGVKTEIVEKELQGSKSYTVRIEGSGEYDFRELVHLGGTSKEQTTTKAGGFGEGAKIAALILLRDFDFTEVKYGSKGWELSFYLDKPPEGSYGKNVRGLWARLTKVSGKQGSYTEFTTTTPTKEHAETFLKARELFQSSENPDFQEPTYVSPSGTGLKLLGPKTKGHFYDAGQRRHYLDESKGWETVEGLHLWTKNKVFGGDRDRGAVSRDGLEERVIKPLVEEMKEDDLTTLINEMEPYWPSQEQWGFEVSTKLLSHAVNRLANEGKRLSFPDRYLSFPAFFPFNIRDELEAQGYVACPEYFEKVGMKSAKDRYLEMQQHLRVEPNEQQTRKIDVLYRALDTIRKVVPQQLSESKLAPKEVWLYSRQNEKSIIEGQYNDQFVWLSEERLNQSFPKALATYLHELDHRYGSDYSAEFSYAVTNSLELVIDAMAKEPEQFKALRSEWDKLVPPATTEGKTQ